jgi:hypothetical protein
MLSVALTKDAVMWKNNVTSLKIKWHWIKITKRIKMETSVVSAVNVRVTIF